MNVPFCIGSKIVFLRGKKVMIDSDLARLYGVQTKRLNEQVKRNLARFPNDFMFVLTKKEKDELVANCDQFAVLKYSSSLPRAFTEQGIAMLSSVLNSEKAIQVNIAIMRVFVRIKELIPTYHKLVSRVKVLEKGQQGHEEDIQEVFLSIDQLQAKQEEIEIKIDQAKEER